MAATPTPLEADDAARVTLEAWLVTDVGVVRDHNEDSATMEPGQGFFIVADGMGGHAAGEVASAMAAETVRTSLQAARRDIEAFKKAPSDAGRRNLVQLLQNAVLQAHQSVYQRGQAEQDKQGMGTTLDVVLIAGAEAFVAHVGDSRTYLVRDGRSSQITTDHTVAEVLVIEGKLTIEEAQVSPLRTILVNAIGVSADVGVEMAHVALKRNDRLLVCSDGLHDYFPADEEIAERLSTEAPGDALQEMVELAKARGGHDNITGIAVHIIEIVELEVQPTDDESTQPTDISNAFIVDEPTHSAFAAGEMTEPEAAIPVAPPEEPSQPGTEASAADHSANHKAADKKPDEQNIGLAETLPPPIQKPKSGREASAAVEPIATADTDPNQVKKSP